MNSKAVFLVCVFLLAGVAAPADGPRRVIGPGVGEPGGISGTVIDAVSGGGYAGAEVFIYRQDGALSWFQTTDTSGTYESALHLVPGTYFVEVHGANGDPSVVYDGLPCRERGTGSEGVCRPLLGTPIEVSSGSVVSGIDLTIGPPVSVEGRVTEVGGQALESVRVSIFNDSGPESQDFVRTDADGEYRFEGLLADTYYVSASNISNPGPKHLPEIFDDLACVGQPGFHCDMTDGTALDAPWGSALTGIDFALEPLGTVSGTIVDAHTGLPIAFARLFGSDGTHDFGGFTLPDGTWLSWALPGTYNVIARQTGYSDVIYPDIPCLPEACDLTQGDLVTIPLGAAIEGVDFSMSPQGRISGRVTDEESEEPIGDLLIVLRAGNSQFLQQTRTDPGGNYAFENVDSVARFVHTKAVPRLWADEVYDDLPCRLDENVTCSLAGATPVVVESGGEAAGIDFDLRPYLFADNFELGVPNGWSQVIGDAGLSPGPERSEVNSDHREAP